MTLLETLNRIDVICRENAACGEHRSSDVDEIHKLLGDVYEALDDAGPQGIDSYIEEKFNGLKNFALMAVGVHERDHYKAEQIIENIGHFAYLVRTRS